MNKRLMIGATVWVASVVSAFFIGSRLERSKSLDSEASSSAPRVSSTTTLVEQRPSTPRQAAAVTFAESPNLSGLHQLFRGDSTQAIAISVRDLTEAWQLNANNEALVVTLEAWGQRDGAIAIERFLEDNETSSSSLRSWALGHLISGWAETDPLGALDWIASKPFTKEESASVFTAMRIAAGRGEGEAALHAAARLPEEAQTAALAAIASGATNKFTSVEEAAQWFLTHAAGSTLEGDLQQPFARQLFGIDPTGAADWAQSISNDKERVPVTTEVARLWSREAPSDAAAWAEALPSGSTRSMALAEVVRAWTPKDALATSEWLGALPASPDLDRAVGLFVMDAARTHPAEAAQWTELITDERARTLAVRRVSRYWMQSDPAAASQWQKEVMKR